LNFHRFSLDFWSVFVFLVYFGRVHLIFIDSKSFLGFWKSIGIVNCGGLEDESERSHREY
jgi:hypothetical protein